METRAFYNDIDAYACAWSRELVAAGMVTEGVVDGRSIADIQAADLAGFTRVHFFSGILGWEYALDLAGWPAGREVWTGSCPCQPFSVAGRGRGTDDPRHLWPELHRLIAECRPSACFGEQVGGRAGLEWLAGVRADLEALGYAVGAADLPAASVGAPHIRQRIFWGARLVADGKRERLRGGRPGPACRPEGRDEGTDGQRERVRVDVGTGRPAVPGALADDAGPRRERPGRTSGALVGAGLGRDGSDNGAPARMADADDPEWRQDASGRIRNGRDGAHDGRQEAHGEPRARGEVDPWSDAVLVECSDGKARRVGKCFRLLDDGISARMAGESTTEAEDVNDGKAGDSGRGSDVFALRSGDSAGEVQWPVGGQDGIRSEDVLQSGVHGGGYGGRDESRQPDQRPATGTEDGGGLVRSVRAVGQSPICSPYRRQPDEQYPGEFADFVRLLPSSIALAQWGHDDRTAEGLRDLLRSVIPSGVLPSALHEVEKVWRSLADEDQARIFLGARARGLTAGPLPVLSRGEDARAPKLRAYGNAIVPQVAAVFIRAFLDAEREIGHAAE